MNIDLVNNTIDGRPVMPRVAELAAVVDEAGGILAVAQVIRRLYGLAGPDNPRAALRQTALLARRQGVSLNGPRTGRPRTDLAGDVYTLGP